MMLETAGHFSIDYGSAEGVLNGIEVKLIAYQIEQRQREWPHSDVVSRDGPDEAVVGQIQPLDCRYFAEFRR
eukprot:CAMPEP_0198131756 /NCGR_PEP_ID=MMETSP1442-20131203/56867_1 /TAXON_ID= /ORGANISM="Craspedostauros australis, Strain CCMP3328" /LENGTH=71 /DNA_ID=CAMNT_0043792619 /DNA_START=405 /DNA_END=621 /DNA_ORIENTATION=+